ncbi:MAG: hypothetical protein ACR2HR_01240 [Euzebya sp.]
MSQHDGLTHTLAAYSALSDHHHIDDAVDHLIARIGWDNAFATLAAMDQVRASVGMYSMICGLFISDPS